MSPPCEAANSFEKFFSYLHATSRGGEFTLIYLTYLQCFLHDTRSCIKKIKWMCEYVALRIWKAMSTSR